MPYVHPSIRAELKERLPRNSGELNYRITNVILDYWKMSKGNYEAINDIVGALEGAKIEFCRRVTAPYEEVKIATNGDVY